MPISIQVKMSDPQQDVCVLAEFWDEEENLTMCLFPWAIHNKTPQNKWLKQQQFISS
jgi:hypothetical protein